MNTYIQRLIDKYVPQEDRILLNFVFSPNPMQETLDVCLTACDIEAMGADKAIALSYVMAEHPELRFPVYCAPRLQGLLTFYRFQNIKTLAHFSKIGKRLNQAGIPVLIFKGGAMKMLRPGLMRPMGDVDLWVPKERLAEAVRICQELGYYDKESGALHSVDIMSPDGGGAVDLHHNILSTHTGNEFLQREMLRRAEKKKAFGVEILLPCPEDLLFIALFNLMKFFQWQTKIYGLYFALLDCRFLTSLRRDFQWRILKDNAEMTGTSAHVGLAASLLNALVPGTLPPECVPLNREAKIFCDRMLFDSEYFLSRRKPAAWQRQIVLPA